MFDVEHQSQPPLLNSKSSLSKSCTIPIMELPADDNRLTEQHDIITSNLGYHIHPTIVKALNEEAGTPAHEIRIADVSQGGQFENTAILPATLLTAQRTRIHFARLLATSTIPDDLRGQFDVVAVRLLHTNLVPDRFQEALDSLIALLKPGGWLQWIDWDPMTARIATVKPGADDIVLREILSRFSEALRTRKSGSTYKISTAMQLQLECEDSDMYVVTPEVRFTKNVVATALLFLERSDACTAEEASVLRGKVKTEIENSGSLLFYDLWCHIARKPIGSS